MVWEPLLCTGVGGPFVALSSPITLWALPRGRGSSPGVTGSGISGVWLVSHLGMVSRCLHAPCVISYTQLPNTKIHISILLLSLCSRCCFFFFLCCCRLFWQSYCCLLLASPFFSLVATFHPLAPTVRFPMLSANLCSTPPTLPPPSSVSPLNLNCKIKHRLCCRVHEYGVCRPPCRGNLRMYHCNT